MIFVLPINESRYPHDSLNKFFAIYRQASVGANISTIGATGAIIGIFQINVMVSFVIYFARLKLQYIFRTCYNAKVATLASLNVNLYITFYFCHQS